MTTSSSARSEIGNDMIYRRWKKKFPTKKKNIPCWRFPPTYMCDDAKEKGVTATRGTKAHLYDLPARGARRRKISFSHAFADDAMATASSSSSQLQQTMR
jgi:hypothetical protein